MFMAGLVTGLIVGMIIGAGILTILLIGVFNDINDNCK
jgi:hypothetical protein